MKPESPKGADGLTQQESYRLVSTEGIDVSAFQAFVLEAKISGAFDPGKGCASPPA